MSITRPIERIPPQNLEAEQSVLGSMLLDRDAIARVVEALRPEDFYRDLHRTIFTAMLELFERGEPVDLITVTNKLTGMGKLEDVGGATYLASLPNTVPPPPARNSTPGSCSKKPCCGRSSAPAHRSPR